MNNNHVEQFGRLRKGFKAKGQQVEVLIQPAALNQKIRQYAEQAGRAIDGGKWLQRPEIPSTSELLDADAASSSSSDVVEIVPNQPQGAWDSKGQFDASSSSSMPSES